jgi:hypothetical protein
MNINKLPVVIGISLLSGVVSSLLLMETKYFWMSTPPREITKEEYSSEKSRGVFGGARFVMEKKTYNYELGALTAVSVFAGLLIFNGLRNGKKTNP